MRILILLLISFSSFGQAVIPFATGRSTDTAKTPGSLRAPGSIVFDKYATSDTNRVLGVTTNGTLIFRTKGGGSVPTLQQVTTSGKTTELGVDLISDFDHINSLMNIYPDNDRAVESKAITFFGYKDSITIMLDNKLTFSNNNWIRTEPLKSGYYALTSDTATIIASKFEVDTASKNVRTWASSTFGTGSGTVTSVATGYGVTGGTITTTGTIRIDTSGTNPPVTTAAQNTFASSYWKSTGNTFGAASRLINTDAFSLTLGVDNIGRDTIFPRSSTTFGRRFTQTAIHSSGTHIGFQFTDSNSSTSTAAETGMVVNLQGAGGSGTKQIIQTQYNGTATCTWDNGGNVTMTTNVILSANTHNCIQGSQYGSLLLTNGSGNSLTRNNADALAAFTVSNSHASSTGAIQNWKVGSSVKDSVDKSGNFAVSGNMSLYGPASKILIKTGSNSTIGTATLVAGTVTVSNTAVTANSYIRLQRKTASGTLLASAGYDYTVSAGTSFTITAKTTLNATETGDTSTIEWLIIDTQ